MKPAVMNLSPLHLFVLPFLFAASPLLAAADNLPQSTDARPGYPEHARKSLERVKSAWGTPRPARIGANATAHVTTSVDGVWSHLGVPELGGHVAIYDPLRDRMLVYGGDDNGIINYDVWSLSMTDPHPWSKLAVGGTPPPSAGSAVYDPVRDRMIVLGGWASVNDVWALSLSGAPQWTQIVPGGTKPAMMGPAIYDPLRDRLILSNGEASIWTLNLAGAPEWTEVVATGMPPGNRSWPSAIYDPVRDRMLMWGGETFDWPIPTDAWALSLSGPAAWTQLQATGTPPGWRVAATAIYDPTNDRMIVYGGTNYWANLSDAWSFSLAGTPAWAELNPPEPIPFSRSFHTAIYDPVRSRMVIFSGWGWKHGPPDRNDVWALALLGDPVWKPVLGTSPEPRAHHSAIYDPVGDRMLIFGGEDYPFSNNDVWSCSLDERPTWNELHPTGELPTTQPGATAVYDRVRDRMIVLGGSGGVNDVWALSLRGTLKWTHLAPKGVPPSGIHAAIYDARRNRIVALATPDNAAWSLSLSSSPRWTPMEATAEQPVPGGDVAIYDRKRDRLLIWGESSNQELWALPLSGHPHWTRITTIGPAPPPRRGYSLIYDETRDRLVMFRGHQHYDDVYTPWALPLTGTLQWQVLSPTGGFPFTEEGHSAIYDPVRDRMVVFGGRYFYNAFNEAWTLTWGPEPSMFASAPGPATALQPCYPNPFNPSVTIPFELQRDGKVTLSIYDVSGRLVATLIDEWTPRGTHTATWDGAGENGGPVASGIYFCRLRVDAFTQTRKMVMLR